VYREIVSTILVWENIYFKFFFGKNFNDNSNLEYPVHSYPLKCHTAVDH